MVNSLNIHQQSGFTLLEVIIYLAFFGVFMTSTISVAYQLLRSTAETGQVLAIQAEGNFILQKLAWALAGQATLTLPAAETVQIVRLDLGAESPLVFSVVSGRWYLTRGAGAATPLSSTAVEVHEADMHLSDTGTLALTFWLDDTPFYFTYVPYE